jgi:CheY-like chemotaxis protein
VVRPIQQRHAPRRALIIDDDPQRFAVIAAWLERTLGVTDVVTSTHFTPDWSGFDVIALDHDLGPGGDMTDHVRATFPNGYALGPVIIHSMNPVGAQRLQAMLPGSTRVPFGIMLAEHKRVALER